MIGVVNEDPWSIITVRLSTKKTLILLKEHKRQSFNEVILNIIKKKDGEKK
jgi:predicted CopG family antitoxin